LMTEFLKVAEYNTANFVFVQNFKPAQDLSVSVTRFSTF
jgi:hypothetical protein